MIIKRQENKKTVHRTMGFCRISKVEGDERKKLYEKSENCVYIHKNIV